MQIRNNLQSPNFGMALKIKQEAIESLRKAPLDNIIKLNKAGEELKDFKVWDLEVYGFCRPRIVSKHAAYVFPAEALVPRGNRLPIEITLDNDLSKLSKKRLTHILNVTLDSRIQAKDAYERIRNAQSWVDRAVEITKVLEQSHISDVDSKIQQRMDKAVYDLFEKYGVNK